jgi:hypothetical protein
VIRQCYRQCWTLPVHQPEPGLGPSTCCNQQLYRIIASLRRCTGPL